MRMLDWRRWNKADRTLFVAFLLFLLALAWHLQARGSLLAGGVLFCAEAALVGGIADWFAVTALFRKPLGFPYHTALLPRRREAFVKASVTMVQKEFFSRRKIFHHLERLHLLPMLLQWLGQPQTKEQFLQQMSHYLRVFLMRQDSARQVEFLAEKVRASLEDVDPGQLFSAGTRWLQQSGHDRDGLAFLARVLHRRAAAPETCEAIEKMLEAYEKEKTKGTFGLLMLSLGEALDLVNLEEAAQLMQKRLVALTEELGTVGSPLQEKVLELLYEQAGVMRTDKEFHLFLHGVKDALLADLPLEEVLAGGLREMNHQFMLPVSASEKKLLGRHSRLRDVLSGEYDRMLMLLQTDEALRHTIGHFLYDLIARSALHAQSLVGVIVRNVLSRLTDEQLNRLVYDKVEPDLLWIRMNGSIVGAGIGLLMYLCLLFART